MKQLILTTCLLLGVIAFGFAQKYYSETAEISLESTTPRDTIKAVNNSGSFKLDLSTNKLEMTSQVKDFVIENKAIERFRGKNFLEVDKHPTATFKGKIAGGGGFDANKTGSYFTEIVGVFTIHGVTKRVQMPAVFTVRNGRVELNMKFGVALKDLKLKLPGDLINKLSDKLRAGIKVDLKRAN